MYDENYVPFSKSWVWFNRAAYMCFVAAIGLALVLIWGI